MSLCCAQRFVEQRLQVLAAWRASDVSLLATGMFFSSLARFVRPAQLPAFASCAWMNRLGVPRY